MGRLERILQYEVIPPEKEKYVYMMAGATVGGIVYPLSMSWSYAISSDLVTVGIIWLWLFAVSNTIKLIKS